MVPSSATPGSGRGPVAPRIRPVALRGLAQGDAVDFASEAVLDAFEFCGIDLSGRDAAGGITMDAGQLVGMLDLVAGELGIRLLD